MDTTPTFIDVISIGLVLGVAGLILYTMGRAAVRMFRERDDRAKK